MSGYTDFWFITEAINQGAIYKFIAKPWNDEQLRADVREAFGHYASNMENIRLAMELKNVREALLNKPAGPGMNSGGELPGGLQALRMSKSILELMPEGLIAIDDQGLIVIANRAARDILGNAAGQLIGCSAGNVLPERVWNYFMESKGKPHAEAMLGLSDDRSIKIQYFDVDSDTSTSGGVLLLAHCETFTQHQRL